MAPASNFIKPRIQIGSKEVEYQINDPQLRNYISRICKDKNLTFGISSLNNWIRISTQLYFKEFNQLCSYIESQIPKEDK